MKRARFLPLVLLMIAIDQTTKWLAFSEVMSGQVTQVIPFLAYLSRNQNAGLMFGLGSSFPGIRFLTIVLSLFVAGVVLWTYAAHLAAYRWRIGAAAFLVFALAGIGGNLLDRLFLGYVRDFLQLRWIANVNLSDIYLSTAALSAIVTLIGGRRSVPHIQDLDDGVNSR